MIIVPTTFFSEPWNLSVDTILTKLELKDQGLSSAQVAYHTQIFGLNSLNQHQNQTLWQILWEQTKNYLLIILVLAAVTSFFLNERVNALVILVMTLLSIILGVIQEYKAEKALDKLKHYLHNQSLVLRNNKWQEIDSSLLTIGDIVQLHIGDIIPADIRLIETDELTVNEAALTGESMPVEKNTTQLKLANSAISKLANMALMGTTVTSGRGEGVVVNIGNNTFYGQTATAVSIKTPPTDFQRNLTTFSKFLVKVILGLTVFIFLANFALHKAIFESFLFAVALAVGVTPEMLPAIMTVSLSEGALKLAKKKVVVKKLISVEDLGNIDILCCDKTGTLTQGQFQLTDFLSLDNKTSLDVFTQALLCTRREKSIVNFNPTDQAILTHPQSEKVIHKIKEYKIVDENEFDFERKRMSVVIKDGNHFTLIAKGAPESILRISKNYIENDKVHPLTAKIETQIINLVQSYEKQGNRVIALAKKQVSHSKTSQKEETELIFTGLLIFSDPLKDGITEALTDFQNLGVRIKIISGDSQLVTQSIAQKANIKLQSSILTGDQLSKLTLDQFKQAVENTDIFCRVSPEQKEQIVATLSKNGHVVGFLGDGINDAPALKIADVGISVNTAAPVAKDSADIILLKKDLAILAEGISAGRKTFGNITKYIFNTISANYGNMITVAVSSLFLKFLPLLPSQILLNNFISDLPLLVVATDNVDPQFTDKPKKWNIKLIAKFMVFFGLISSLFDLCLILPLVFLFHIQPQIFRTAWFVESSLSEIIITFAIRTKLPFYKSKPSNLLIVTSLVAIVLVLWLPTSRLGHKFFEFSKLPGYLWLLIGLILIGYFLTVEIAKKIFYRHFAKE